MAVIIKLTVTLYLVSSTFGAIPIDNLNIKVLPSSALLHPDFESELLYSLQTKKNFFAENDVAVGTNIVATWFAVSVAFSPHEKLASLGAILPIVQMALSAESNFKPSLAKTVADGYVRTRLEIELDEIEARSKLMFHDLKNLNTFLSDPNEKSPERKTNIITQVRWIQNALLVIITKILGGNSKFWLYPHLVAPSLLGLSLFIKEFAPVRDEILNYEDDESIISCLVKDALQLYYPKVLRWRLKKIGLGKIPHNGIARKIQTVLDNPQLIFNGDEDYFTKHPIIDCFISDNICDQDAENITCFTDKIQGKLFQADDPGKRNNECIYEYLMFVRLRVKETFDNAIDLMNNTCSNRIDMRERITTGMYRIYF